MLIGSIVIRLLITRLELVYMKLLFPSPKAKNEKNKYTVGINIK